ncbi:MAG: hypothetical protein KGJ02_01480 [Verrucomicrobiota bacterium]|nr:hypothetical protein [Verrucomicrobiota bacterium]
MKVLKVASEALSPAVNAIKDAAHLKRLAKTVCKVFLGVLKSFLKDVVTRAYYKKNPKKFSVQSEVEDKQDKLLRLLSHTLHQEK